MVDYVESPQWVLQKRKGYEPTLLNSAESVNFPVRPGSIKMKILFFFDVNLIINSSN